MTCRPGNETVLSKEKVDQSPSRRYRQNRALSDTAPPPGFLRSGYALPSSPRRRRRVILIVAGSSSRLSRETGETFRAWVEQFLAPTLREGNIVVMDNLSSHKVAGVKAAIEKTGARLRYLPPYSPDLNPIEQFFAKLKALLQKAAARTLEALIDAIADALTKFKPHECENYLDNSGYRHRP